MLFGRPKAQNGLKVLICDDERHIVRLIQVNLERQGYEVDTASTVKIALEKLNQSNFNILVLDSTLPDMSSDELLRIVRSTPAYESLKVIYLGSKAHAAADMHLTKPIIDWSGLTHLIARIKRQREPMTLLTHVLGQPSYHITNGGAEAFVTRTGGQVGPVTFDLNGRKVSPYHVAPWAEEGAPGEPPIIEVLRGDFFCMPFGSNDAAYGSEQHPIHGQTANEDWDLVALDTDRIEMRLQTTIRPGTVDKRIVLTPNAVYSRHTITGMEGPMSFGHHAMLRFRTEGLVSCSPFGYGQVYPYEFESPIKGGYSSLKQAARFQRLDEVPMSNGGIADLTHYPARGGFEDLVMLATEKDQPLGWTAVVFPEEGYLWLSLKDPKVLPATVLWHSNGGRHYAPWSGRHRGVLGIEEVCSYFHTGLAESAEENEVSRAGYRTHHLLEAQKALEVATVMAVAEVPGGFDHVDSVTNENGSLLVRSKSGKVVQIELNQDLHLLP